jgi:hypothetical protein
MNDLPRRLRRSVPKMTGVAAAHCNDVEAVHLAADELERLMAENRTLRNLLAEPGVISQEAWDALPGSLRG